MLIHDSDIALTVCWHESAAAIIAETIGGNWTLALPVASFSAQIT
jgi:hypothetical protein